MIRQGIHEFVFGLEDGQQDEWLQFWEMLGFTPVLEGRLDRDQAERLYGHASALHSFRLAHPGCKTFGTGLVRLHFWSHLRNDGLADARPTEIGSRWMGLYTNDILQVRDSFSSQAARNDWRLWMSPLVNAPLAKPAPEHDFYTPFVGLRETVILGDRFRLAFIQRAGFDRPGFGTFDDSLPYKNTEGSHANVIQPAHSFSTEFYKSVFGFETAPFGEAHDSGDDPATMAALNLRDGELFRVERTRAPDCPSGILQVYAPYSHTRDLREHSRAGCANLGLYSVRTDHLDRFAETLTTYGPNLPFSRSDDEFGHPAMCFDAPDGYQWLISQDVA